MSTWRSSGTPLNALMGLLLRRATKPVRFHDFSTIPGTSSSPRWLSSRAWMPSRVTASRKVGGSPGLHLFGHVPVGAGLRVFHRLVHPGQQARELADSGRLLAHVPGDLFATRRRFDGLIQHRRGDRDRLLVEHQIAFGPWFHSDPPGVLVGGVSHSTSATLLPIPNFCAGFGELHEWDAADLRRRRVDRQSSGCGRPHAGASQPASRSQSVYAGPEQLACAASTSVSSHVTRRGAWVEPDSMRDTPSTLTG
jgi:hypothetical protein